MPGAFAENLDARGVPRSVERDASRRAGRTLVGFRTVQGRTDPASGVRRLDKIDLWEISVVTFPMLPEARVDAVKRRKAHSPRLTAHMQRRLAGKFRHAARVLRAI